mgnify:FL=1
MRAADASSPGLAGYSAARRARALGEMLDRPIRLFYATHSEREERIDINWQERRFEFREASLDPIPRRIERRLMPGKGGFRSSGDRKYTARDRKYFSHE